MTTPPLIYVECDVPEGMRLADWRHSRARPVPRRRVPRPLVRLLAALA